jgi:hypothetical protein
LEIGTVVHRLDRATSGVVIFALDTSTARRISAQITAHEVTKHYIARVRGSFPNDGIIECKQPITCIAAKYGMMGVGPDGKEALTTFKRLAFDDISNTSLVHCIPRTGRTHQIRVHLQWLGYPIANDERYGGHIHLTIGQPLPHHLLPLTFQPSPPYRLLGVTESKHSTSPSPVPSSSVFSSEVSTTATTSAMNTKTAVDGVVDTDIVASCDMTRLTASRYPDTCAQCVDSNVYLFSRFAATDTLTSSTTIATTIIQSALLNATPTTKNNIDESDAVVAGQPESVTISSSSSSSLPDHERRRLLKEARRVRHEASRGEGKIDSKLSTPSSTSSTTASSLMNNSIQDDNSVWLHAIAYVGPSFAYQSPWPSWAVPDDASSSVVTRTTITSTSVPAAGHVAIC